MPYVKECIEAGTDLEVTGLYTWLSNYKCKNLKFLFTCVLHAVSLWIYSERE